MSITLAVMTEFSRLTVHDVQQTYALFCIHYTGINTTVKELFVVAITIMYYMLLNTNINNI